MLANRRTASAAPCTLKTGLKKFVVLSKANLTSSLDPVPEVHATVSCSSQTGIAKLISQAYSVLGAEW